MTIANIKLLKKEEGEGLRFHIEKIDRDIDILVLHIPEKRIYSEDFEYGLTHEITEATLREIILSIVEEGILFPKWIIHEMTILSLPKYPLVKQQYEEAESLFKKKE